MNDQLSKELMSKINTCAGINLREFEKQTAEKLMNRIEGKGRLTLDKLDMLNTARESAMMRHAQCIGSVLRTALIEKWDTEHLSYELQLEWKSIIYDLASDLKIDLSDIEDDMALAGAAILVTDFCRQTGRK